MTDSKAAGSRPKETRPWGCGGGLVCHSKQVCTPEFNPQKSQLLVCAREAELDGPCSSLAGQPSLCDGFQENF